MRLLSTKDFTFHEFAEDALVPPYAILSHTWDGDEVTLQEMQKPNARRILQSSNPPNKSWKKIQDACSMACLKGFLYIWIDSCCIDKTNSAELQEAINSMFRWYRNSTVCLALLSDVDKSDFEFNEFNDELRSYATLFCRWFTRGWTLQELLAPNELLFFDVNWKQLGSRSDWASRISKATGIHVKFLLGIELDPCKTWDLEAVLRDISVATKMSWAAGRQTTRVEDEAYCLLGLFDIHMPMLYGEGRKAFARLQQEIMKSTDDCTLLAWGYNEPPVGAPVSEIPFYCRCRSCCTHRRANPPPSSDTLDFDLPSEPLRLGSHLSSCAYADVASGPQGGARVKAQFQRDQVGVRVKAQFQRDLKCRNAGGRPRSLFATSPRDFRFAGTLEPCSIPGHKRPAFAMSQRGLEISLPVAKDKSHRYIIYGLLACSAEVNTLVAIPLVRSSVIRFASEDHDDEYVQSPFCLPCKVPVSFAEEAERQSICIRNEDHYRRLWDSAGYWKRPLILDFGHPLATKKGGSSLRLELMYPSQPMCSMYFTLLRPRCPLSATEEPCAPLDTLPPDWWWSHSHLTRPSCPFRVQQAGGRPWDDKIHRDNMFYYFPGAIIAAVVLNFGPFPLEPETKGQIRILLVVSSDLSCRVRKLGPNEAITLQTLMTIAQKPEMAGPKLELEQRIYEQHEGWKEAFVVYKLPDGIELCLRMWGIGHFS